MQSTTFLGTRYKCPTTVSHRLWNESRRSAKKKEYGPTRFCRTTYPGYLIVGAANDHDEGYSFTETTIDFRTMTACVITGGRDCDGPVEYYTNYYWNGENWIKRPSRVLDHYAQQMGY